MIAGGVESMSRAPFVMPKAESAFSRANAVYDTTIGWRFVNQLMQAQYGVDSMPETAENVATDYHIERAAQDRMALASQLKAVAAQQAGHFAREIVGVSIAQKKGDALLVDTISRSDTYPAVDVREDDVSMGHEATVSRVSDEQLFYLQSRGMPEDEAMAMIVRGFIEPIAKELPMEYALELNRLIELQMEGAVG